MPIGTYFLEISKFSFFKLFNIFFFSPFFFFSFFLFSFFPQVFLFFLHLPSAEINPVRYRFRDLPSLLTKIEGGEQAINVILSMDETYADISPVRPSANKISAYVFAIFQFSLYLFFVTKLLFNGC